VNFKAALANGAWFAASVPEWIRYEQSAANVELTQNRLLQRYLRQNAATEFGKAHDFARIRNWNEYAERVPAGTYDDFCPWIERIADGAPCVLTAERVGLLEPSSGSSGPEKWIPYTKSLQAEFRRAVAVWITRNFADNPGLFRGRAYWSLTPQSPHGEATDSQIPVGFDEDSAYLGGAARRLIDMTLVTRPELRLIPDMDQFWHASLLLLLKCRDLRLISAWHPSFVMLLLQHLQSGWWDLLADLSRGITLPVPYLCIGADPVRSKQLESLDPLVPKDIWPRLCLISCWGDAHAAGSIRELRALFPGVKIQPKGLVATEAFATLSFDEFRPLAIRSHFFEFQDDAGDIHPAWDLEAGNAYSLIVTTGGGLYRYRLQDRVEVTGYYREVPSLRFLGKEDNISDFFGEKLTEAFAASALQEAFTQHDLNPQFSMLAMDESGDEPGYTLYIQAAGEVPLQLDRDLEAELRRNPHYDLCIRLGQLRPVLVAPIATGAYEDFSQRLTKRGMRLGDIKPTSLSRFSDWSSHFSELRRS
jgi:hypothetical protein